MAFKRHRKLRTREQFRSPRTAGGGEVLSAGGPGGEFQRGHAEAGRPHGDLLREPRQEVTEAGPTMATAQPGRGEVLACPSRPGRRAAGGQVRGGAGEKPRRGVGFWLGQLGGELQLLLKCRSPRRNGSAMGRVQDGDAAPTRVAHGRADSGGKAGRSVTVGV